MPKLTTKTRELLANRPRPVTYAHIEAETGIKVRWLIAFAKDGVSSPSCDDVETLYEYLSGRTLDV